MTGTIGKMKTLHTQKGETIKNQKGIFCEGILENLISVGELCDSQHTIVFTNTHSAIYVGQTKIEGVCIHKQQRDERSGMYHITLHERERGEEHRENVCTKEGEKRTTCRTIDDIKRSGRAHLAWAQLVTKQKKEPWYGDKERTRDTVREEIDREIKATCVFLARFYLKEGMSDIERWHNKLAHQGTKILARCNIKNLKQPHRCEHCIDAKIHSGDHSTDNK